MRTPLYVRSRAYRWLFWHGVPFIRDDSGLTRRQVRQIVRRYAAQMKRPS